MKRVRCPKCDNFITFDEKKYTEGQSLVFQCPDCGKRHAIFGDSHIDEVAEKYGVDVLARLPMNPDFAAMCDEGKVMDIPNPGIDAEKLLDKAASVKIASSLMGGWTVAE